MVDYNDLLAKGYTPKEAQRTLEIIRYAKLNKSPRIKSLESFIYWALLLITIVGNLVITILLIPFLLAFKKAPLYITIVLLAAMFGFLFDLLIRDLEHIEHKHHIVAWAFIPALAIISTYYMVSFMNYTTETLKLPFQLHSPILISATYVVSFTIPYFIHKFLESRM